MTPQNLIKKINEYRYFVLTWEYRPFEIMVGMNKEEFEEFKFGLNAYTVGLFNDNKHGIYFAGAKILSSCDLESDERFIISHKII